MAATEAPLTAFPSLKAMDHVSWRVDSFELLSSCCYFLLNLMSNVMFPVRSRSSSSWISAGAGAQQQVAQTTLALKWSLALFSLLLCPPKRKTSSASSWTWSSSCPTLWAAGTPGGFLRRSSSRARTPCPTLRRAAAAAPCQTAPILLPLVCPRRTIAAL